MMTEESNTPWDVLDLWFGRVRDFFAAIGLVTAAGALGYFSEIWK